MITQSGNISVNIINNGNETLTTVDNYTTNSEFSVINPLTSLTPGEMQTVEIVYNASSANASGAYRIYSNPTRRANGGLWVPVGQVMQRTLPSRRPQRLEAKEYQQRMQELQILFNLHENSG
mgnify:CR=1 FL=1